MDLILSRFNVNNKHGAYREMVQSYSNEGKEMWEGLRHGLILGSQGFADRIKAKFKFQKPDIEVPQRRQVLRGNAAVTTLNKAASILKCDIGVIINSGRVSGKNKDKRDVLIYLLWNTGLYNNKEIGELFGLGYSSISRQIAIMKSRLSKDKAIQEMLTKVNSLFKI